MEKDNVIRPWCWLHPLDGFELTQADLVEQQWNTLLHDEEQAVWDQYYELEAQTELIRQQLQKITDSRKS